MRGKLKVSPQQGVRPPSGEKVFSAGKGGGAENAGSILGKNSFESKKEL